MKVLVIGDIIVDRYIYGTASRLSPEAPVPVVEQNSVSDSLGGAGLVYENLKSLGVDVDLYDIEQPCSVKTRVFCDGHYLTRIDNDTHADSNEVVDSILNQSFDKYDYVILSDYNKGVLDNCAPIIDHLNSFGCRVIVDPKSYADNYSGAWLVKPNHKEYVELGFKKWKHNIIVTHASQPVFANIDKVTYNEDIDSVEVSDVTGAGDCFLAAFVYALTKGYDYAQAIKLAIKGSGESVKHLGGYILKMEDIENRVIFANGVFDVLHKGHFELLKTARTLGNRLVVGINSDLSTKRLKGADRPINNEQVRKAQLESLPWVDEVIIFEEDTPYNVISKIQPHTIVKGGDYKQEQVVGNDIAEVYIVPHIAGYSTTNVLEMHYENSSNRT